MISILCYGRNDAHSAGLQKRAALSLNGFAALLDHPDDEIVFVDYNTPDELPTFPEAIADTLTEEARRRLRVIRVRPSHHEPWRHRTALPLPEPLARNAGLRRTNPANPWVLSTNTDIILVPRRRRSLSAVCARLEPPGCWHVPRYELPEAVWQGFDRADPAATIRELAGLAGRLPLRQIVRGAGPAIFDNHGDFQLVRRDDLFAVHGFDERMLNGWAVDSNLSLRLQLRSVAARSLANAIEAFHCAHHRAISPLHRHGRSENDYQRFCRDVARPDLPGQAETWGLAGVSLEEIRLDGTRRQRWIDALSPGAPAEVVYNPENGDQPYYPAPDVLVHLLDLLAERADGTVIGWCGARPHMLRLFLTAWRALGRAAPVLVPEGCAAVEGTRSVPLARLVERAEVAIFEFGCPSQDDPSLAPSRPGAWSDDDLAALAPVREALLAAPADRLLVAVNAIYNRFEPLVLERIGAGRIPFATRLRHGRVRADSGEDFTAPAVADWLGRRMGRRQPVPVSEAVRLMGWAEALLAGELPPARLAEAARSAPAMLALLEHPRFACDQALDRARQAIGAARGSVRLAGRLGVPVTEGAPPDGPARLATIEDWEDGDFADLARRHFDGSTAANVTRRSALRWSRIRVLLELLRRGALGKVAVVGDHADPLVDALSTLCAHVHVLSDASQASSGLRDPRQVGIGSPPREPFDAAVLLAPGALPLLAPHAPVLRVERVRVDVAAPVGLALSRASVDSALWPGEPADLSHFLSVGEDGAITTMMVSS